nr:PREDICTED: uncharacterized protein LOC106706865 [Latimeria chalumnae]|eukprot:XP_014353865.1 PREDICTED: uncharacterized protein LOC106706865 [Latimeria chalumnae]
MEREKEEMATLGEAKAAEETETTDQIETKKEAPQGHNKAPEKVETSSIIEIEGEVPKADKNEGQTFSELYFNSSQSEQINLPLGKVKMKQTTNNMEEESAEGKEKQTVNNMEEENVSNKEENAKSDGVTETPMTLASTGIQTNQLQTEPQNTSAGSMEEIPSTSREQKTDSFLIVPSREKKKSKVPKEKSLDWAEIVAKQEGTAVSRILRRRRLGSTIQQRGKGRSKELLQSIIQMKKAQRQRTVTLKNRFSPLDTELETGSSTEDLHSPEEIMATLPEQAGEKRKLFQEDPETAVTAGRRLA